MGWIEKVKNIIGGLRASGKSEQEIEDIMQQAADKATVVTPEEVDDTVAEIAVGLARMAGTFARDAMDAMCYAMQAFQQQGGSRQQTNNWRKMHGLPMRRKGKRDDDRTNRDDDH